MAHRFFFISARHLRFSQQHGQNGKILTQTIKAKLFVYKKWIILFLCSWSKLFIFKQKTMRQIFYMLQSTWKCIRKSLKSWENIEGKISHFCLRPKTWLGYYDPRFDLSSKIFLVGSSFQVVLILVWNRNCTQKFSFWNLAILRDPHS